MAKLELKNNELEQCKNIKEQIEEARKNEEDIKQKEFVECEETQIDSYNIEFSNIIFKKCKCQDSNFNKVTFSNVIFEDCDFSNCDFSESTFIKVKIKNCKFIGNDLSESIIYDSEILESNFEYANLLGIIIK